jgi:hypothetical protein
MRRRASSVIDMQRGKLYHGSAVTNRSGLCRLRADSAAIKGWSRRGRFLKKSSCRLRDIGRDGGLAVQAIMNTFWATVRAGTGTRRVGWGGYTPYPSFPFLSKQAMDVLREPKYVPGCVALWVA